MASQQDIKNQRELNNEQQRLVDQYGNLLESQKSVNEQRTEELRSTREISDEIRKQLGAVKENLDFKTSTRRILSEINKLSEQNVDFSSKEKGFSLDISNIQERQKKLAQTKLSLFREQSFVSSKITTLENEIKTTEGEQKEILEEQLTTFKRLERSLYDQVESSDSLTKNLSQAKKAAQEINKVKAPKGFEFLSDLTSKIPGLGKLSTPFKDAAVASKDTAARMTKINLAREQMGKKAMFSKSQIGLKSMSAGFKALGPVIKSAFGPLSIVLTIVSAVKAIFKAMMAGSKEVTGFRKSFGVSRDAAVEIRDRTFEISEQAASFADTQGKVLILQKQITEQLTLVNQSLGTAIDFTRELGKEFGSKLLVQSALLKDNIGLSTSAIGELQKETIRTGQDVEDLTKEMEGTVAATSLTKGFMLDVKQIMEEVTKIQGELRLNFGNSNTEIAKAVTQAKLLGFELSDLQGPASKLLDFESSIASELEAELLIGKNLNLEKARQAALDGDLVTLGQEITKQGVDYTQLQKMNVIQRKAFADAVGLSVDQLANTLKKQEEYNALQQRAEMAGKRIANIENKSMKEIYDDLQKQGASEEKIKEILGERLFATQKAEDAQQKFNKALESVKEKFAKIFDGDAAEKFGDGMIKFAEFINKFVTSVNKKGLGRTIFFGIDEEPSQKQVDKATQVLTPAERQALNTGRNPGTSLHGPKFAEGGIVTKRVNNATIGEAGPEAVIPLNEFYRKFDELIAAVKQGGDVYMDSTKVGTAMSVGTYKVQ